MPTRKKPHFGAKTSHVSRVQTSYTIRYIICTGKLTGKLPL